MARDELIQSILKHFLKSLLESLKPFNEVSERVAYLESLIGLAKGNYSEHEPNEDFGIDGYEFDSEGFIRQHILLKFREKAKGFQDEQLQYYFERDAKLQSYLFKHLGIDAPLFSNLEYEKYINIIYSILHKVITNTCTQPAGHTADEKQTLSEATETERRYKSQSKEYTRSRQMLLFFFLMKALGKERNKTDLTELAAFAHYLFAWPVDNVKSTSVYDMLKRAPALRANDDALIAELEFIKRQFERIELAEAVTLVQKEISSIKRSRS